MIEKFQIHIDDSEIELLHKKIELTRWPDEVNDSKWSYGTSLKFMQHVADYWVNNFNWRDHEAYLNDIGSFKFKTSSGLKLHFLHSKSSNPNAIPLLLTHGWPGSIQEFLKIIPLLQNNPEIDFHIVCPALVGFGFSDKATEPGMSSEEIAKLQHELMLELGYDKYIVQGGDWGATVSKWMAELFPESCLGIHLNLVIAWPPADGDPMEGLSKDEIKGLENHQKYQSIGSGYYAIQSTKPQTLGYGLNDSPIGLAAWIIEKFHAWTDDENNKLMIDLDEVLAIVSLYWFTESITSSARIYKANSPEGGFSFNPVSTPFAGVIFNNEIIKPPRAWAEKIYNVVQWNNYDGGHFAAIENPEVLAQDIINFVKKLEL
ncbi:epoxide hydrolase [Gammaproteobacteria bacterium]|nr:epoxide hydrolase [Gammaproteobacteria bacterium]